MINRLWDINEAEIEKQGVFWNAASSGVNSVVSMLLLLVVTRVCSVQEAGIFSLGFSTSQMMLTIGNYGMRNYQVSDIENKYSMRTYIASRIITNTVMMVAVTLFCIIEKYYMEKAVVTILLCMLKMTDAYEDVYGGFYQKSGRLDISGKMMTYRIGIYVFVFCLSILISKNLIFSCLLMCGMSAILVIVFVGSTRKVFFFDRPKFNGKDEVRLLIECFPLCLSAFLLMYIGNAPKYAIDLYLAEEAQAYYTYLFMPCFVTNLFVGFALQPLLVKISKYWLHQNYKEFIKLCGYILVGAMSIATIFVGAGRVLGCPILSIIFGVQLEEYKNVLTILLIGGGFFSFSVIAQIILTVMRRQVWLLIGFGGASVVAFAISNPLVRRIGLMGAGYAYTVSAGVLFMILGVMIIFFMKKEMSTPKKNT